MTFPLFKVFLSSSLNDLLYHPITFILGIILAISINLKLTLFCFAIIPISIILALIISKPVEKYTKRQQEALSDVNSVAQDAISGITIVKAFNLEKELFNKYRKELVKSFKSGLTSARFETLSEPIKIMIQIIPFVLMFFYGGNLVLKGELTLGGIIAFIELMNIFLAPMNVLPNIINSYRKAKSSSERIEELLNQEDEKGGYVKDEKKSDYDIEFEDVYFSYEEKEIIKGISFKVKRGEKVAIVGESGSGKSTIVKLLLGLYKPQKGNIKIFGVDIKDWDLSTLREKISVANQDIYLFPESIKENIRYGNYNAKDEDIISATKKSLAYDFIMDNIGFERKIGERGSSISGGERQRIAIARALLKKSARLFILDEATSALDTETEHTLQNILKEELKDKTVLIIAHRFSSIKIAERIIVIDDGKIIEEGTHEELFNKKGAYYQLYSKQLIQNHNSLVGGR
jgi:ABC-type multidrug transport system fused ATPase/permease subunit